MVDAVEPTPSDSAEKAYAAAAELAIAQADSVKAEPAAELQFPAKPKRAEAPLASKAAVAAPAAAIVVPAEIEADLVMKAKQPAKSAPAKNAAVKAAKLAKPAPVAANKPVVAKKATVARQAVAKPAIAAKQAATKPLAAIKPAAPNFKSTTTTQPKIKEPTMTAKTTKDYTAIIKSAGADVQAKAKLALAKGSEVLGEVSEFTKGNVEALKTSGTILGTGLQDLGKTYVAEGKSAYATVTGDVKELKAVKTPTDFVRLQTSILRRNLDHAFNFGGKNSETMIKLAGEAFAPISARANLAVAKVKKAA